MRDGNERKTLTPKLRFPQFRDRWTSERLGRLAKTITERAGDKDCTPFSVTTGVGLVSQKERFGRTIAGNAFKNYFLLQKNDFAYNKSATKAYPQGYIARFMRDEKGAVPNSIFTCFRADPCLINPVYLDYLFAGNLHGRWLRRYIEVSARAHGSLSIDDADLMSLPVPLPGGASSLVEQQKIANCLTSLDEVIAAQGRKVEALKAHKKGLMQQLFPREGETLPRLRFPEFRNAPAWEERSLRSICERIMDGTHFSPKAKSGPRPYLTSKNIRDGWIDLSTVSYISEEEHREIYARCPVRKFDILLTKDGANTGNCAINTLDYEFSLLSSVAVLRGNSLQLNQEFLYQSIASERIQSMIANSISGQAITRITLEKLANYAISLTSIPEQERIAYCLSTLDLQITAESQKLDTLKTHKKSLMQQLFPSPEEVEA